MIDAKELRFGNLVNEEVLGDCKVSGILKETVWVEVKNIKSNGSHNLREFHINIECLKPIPLTEEWLFKFGFSKNENRNVFENQVMLIYKQDGFFWFDLISDSIFIENVHQLQNLYHALNNEELTIIK